LGKMITSYIFQSQKLLGRTKLYSQKKWPVWGLTAYTTRQSLRKAGLKQ